MSVVNCFQFKNYKKKISFHLQNTVQQAKAATTTAEEDKIKQQYLDEAEKIDEKARKLIEKFENNKNIQNQTDLDDQIWRLKTEIIELEKSIRFMKETDIRQTDQWNFSIKQLKKHETNVNDMIEMLQHHYNLAFSLLLDRKLLAITIVIIIVSSTFF